MIEKVKSESCIEVGCNNWLYTFGVSKLCPAMGIDYDKDAINEAHTLNKKFKSNCNFLYLNLLDEKSMIRSYGQSGSYGSIIERLNCDMLIAPAIIYHLFDQCKETDRIISIFTQLSKNYMIIEQIPETIDSEKLYGSLKKYNWRVVEELPSCPYPRKWLFCIKEH